MQETAPVAIPNNALFNYIVVVLMENNGFCSIITTCGGSGSFETQLAHNYSLATHYSAVDHPSLPNYLALTTGNTFDSWSSGDCDPVTCTWYPNFPSIPNIVDRIEAAGLTWKAYMEDYPGSGAACTSFSSNNCSPGGCYVGDGGLGNYAAHHDPFVYPRDIVNSQARCSKIVPANSVVRHSQETDNIFLNDLKSATTASNFMWLTPNNRDDMHDKSVRFGDKYLSQLVPQILNSYVFQTQKAGLFITFDEGRGNFTSDFVYSAWAGPIVKTNYQSSRFYDHYSVLTTIESAWNLSPLTSNDTSAPAMTEFFTGMPLTLSTTFTYGPASPIPNQTVTFTASAFPGTDFRWDFSGTVLKREAL